MTKPSTWFKLSDKIVFVLTIFLLSCFLIFEKYSWGKYAFFIASGLIFLVDMFASRRKIVLRFDKFHKYFGLFVLFCFASILWAISRENAFEWSKSLLNNLICITLIYPYYSKKKDISMLLSTVMWSGFIVAIYTISYYGLDRLFASSYTQYIRLGNDFSNINTVGMFCALGLLILFERILNEKKIRWFTIFAIPSFIVVAATQSRKAIIMLVIGILLITLLKGVDDKNFIKTVGKIIIIISLVALVLYGVSKISILSGVNQRLLQLLSVVTGTGEIDSGTINRKKYIELGIQTWLQYPLGGVGINCPRIINRNVFGEYVYLHNNYVELLCGQSCIQSR